MRTIAVNSMLTGKRKNRGYAESWTSEQLDKLLSEPWLKQMVAEIRAGDVKKKDELPYICPHYTQFRNNHRAQADIIPEAFTYMTCVDVDDFALVDKAIKRALELNEDEYSDWKDMVLRIEYSARRKVHIYIRIPKGMTIEEAQRAFCKELEVPYDESCITPERFIYLTGKDEEVYRSEHWLEPLSEEELNERREAYLNRGLDVDGRKLEAVDSLKLKVDSEEKAGVETADERTRYIFNACMREAGLTANDLIEEGGRHNSLKSILSVGATQLLTQAELNSVLSEMMPEHWQDQNIRQLVKDFYERYSEPNQKMTQFQRKVYAQSRKMEKKEKPLSNSPEGENKEEQKGSVYAQLPLEEWSKELQELAKSFPCMKELFMNVHPMKLPAVLFSSAAMFGTLMTRVWYHFWYEPSIVRRLNYSIFIIGDPGAGKNLVEKIYKALMAPIKERDQELINQVNDYKDNRTERSTSTKAQKGDALKRPVVPIRIHPARTATGEFIRHMTAAVETVKGQTLNLHMFSFDAELDNATKQNKGGDWKDREILELKAFHNEEDGQMYANTESVTGMFNVYWNFVFTGTPYALGRKVNQRNFGNGLSTRLAVIPLPDKGIASRKQESNPQAGETLMEWAYRLDKVEGELPIEPLNDETYEWQSNKLEIAEFNNDRADRILLKRVPYYGIGVAIPFILMRHWNEWQKKKTLTMDEKDRRLCRLAMEIQYRCQHFFFGEMARIYFEDQNKMFVPRKRTTRYQECYNKLPETFTSKQFQEVFECSQQTASRALLRFQSDGVVKRVKFGHYKKVLQALT